MPHIEHCRQKAENFILNSALQDYVRLEDNESIVVDTSLPCEKLDEFIELCSIIHWRRQDLYLDATLGPPRAGLLAAQGVFSNDSSDVAKAIDARMDALCATEPVNSVLATPSFPSAPFADKKIVIADGPRGRGLFSLETISPHHDVLTIPRAQLLNVYTALSDPGFSPTAREMLRLAQSEEEVVIAYVATLRNQSHPALQFAPLDVSAYRNLLTWPQEAVELLQSPQIEGAVKAELCALQELNTVLKNVTKIPYALDDLVWAHCVVHSRAFCIDIPGEFGKVTTLAPCADLLNHSFTGALASPVYDSGKEALIFRSVATILPGCECLLNYGPLQSWEEVLHYGFLSAQTSNVFDSIQLDFECDDVSFEEHAIFAHSNSPHVVLKSLAGENADLGWHMDFAVHDVMEEVLSSLKPEEVEIEFFESTEYGQLARRYRDLQRRLIETNLTQLRKRIKI